MEEHSINLNFIFFHVKHVYMNRKFLHIRINLVEIHKNSNHNILEIVILFIFLKKIFYAGTFLVALKYLSAKTSPPKYIH